MSWHKMSTNDKLDYLTRQMEEIERAKALINRFEKLTRKWLKTVEAQPKQAPREKGSKRK